MKIGSSVFSNKFFIASCLMYFVGLCTLVAFSAPYWSQSYPSTGNSFKSIGLWEACFYRYRHWKDDDQKPYTGCFWFWSPDMIRFRDWLMPTWFMAVQFFACFALIFVFVALSLLSVSFLTNLRSKIGFMMGITILCFAATLMFFLALLLYGLNGDNREWMPRPEFNVYSISYWFELAAAFFTLISTTLYFYETKDLIIERRKRLRKIKRLNNGDAEDDIEEDGDDDDNDEAYVHPKTNHNRIYNSKKQPNTYVA